MRIFSYFAHLRAKRRQFYYDRVRITVSLRMRPRNWSGLKRHKPDIPVYSLNNDIEDMRIWLANDAWGLDFSVEGRKYGMNFWGELIPWRRKLLKTGIEASQHPSCHLWGNL